jgi:predicted Fe-Mo cluster-binding NifX family protein
MRLEDGAVTERRTLANPYLEEDRAKGIRVAEWLVEQKVDVVFLRESLRGKGPVYAFGDAGVEMRETEAGTLDEAVEEARREDVR